MSLFKPKFLGFTATSRILGRKTTGAGGGEELTLSEILDFIGSATAGDILYRGASAWAKLAKGTDGQVLTLASGLPSWAAASGGSPHSLVFLTSNESVESYPSYGNIPGLSKAVSASTNYLVMIRMFVYDQAGTCALGASIPTGAKFTGIVRNQSSLGKVSVVFLKHSTGTITSWNTGRRSIEVTLMLEVGSTAGNFTLQSVNYTSGDSALYYQGSGFSIQALS